MNEVFGVDIAAIVNDTFAGNLHPLMLHKAASTIDSYGSPVTSYADHAGEGVRLKWKTETAVARGYPVNAVKILVLQNGIVAPSKDDEVTIMSERWRVIDIEQDPVNATWSLAAVKV